jgi:hypothetical protein
MQALTITRVNQVPFRWRRSEFRVMGVPTSPNPFDPYMITVDATITSPSGKTLAVPGFWFQAYYRAPSGPPEQLTKISVPFWCVRFTPSEIGNHTISVAVTLNKVLDPSSAH